MKSLLYTVLFVAAIYLINRTYGILVSSLFTVIVLAVILYNRRATILTRLANQAYYIKGNTQKAEKLYEAAYKTGIMTPQCKISYSSFCLRENKFARGKKLLNEVINSRFSESSDKLGAKHNLAVLLWREGDLEGAIGLLETVHKQVPATNTYGTLGVLYLERAKQGNPEEYLPFMLEAYEYNDSDKTICDNLGELYYILGEYEKAKEVYEKAMKLSFQTPVPYYNYGRVLKALGDKDGALEYFEKALNCKFTAVMTITEEDVKEQIAFLS